MTNDLKLVQMNQEELFTINGGADVDYIYAGATFAAIGVGLMAAACTVALPVVAVAALAYVGIWGISGGIACGVIGICK